MLSQYAIQSVIKNAIPSVIAECHQGVCECGYTPPNTTKIYIWDIMAHYIKLNWTSNSERHAGPKHGLKTKYKFADGQENLRYFSQMIVAGAVLQTAQKQFVK